MAGPAQSRHPAAIPALSLIPAELGAGPFKGAEANSFPQVTLGWVGETAYLPWVKGERTALLGLLETEENTAKM